MQRMFPDSYHVPSLPAKLRGSFFIAASVALKFPPPVCAITFGFGRMLRTGMPETAVYEHRDPEFWKNEIGFSKHRLISSPTYDAMLPEKVCQRLFRILVPARTNTRHHFRTFVSSVYVDHLTEYLLAYMIAQSLVTSSFS